MLKLGTFPELSIDTISFVSFLAQIFLIFFMNSLVGSIEILSGDTRK